MSDKQAPNEKLTVTGYLHNVSPVKESRDRSCKYFNMVVQTSPSKYYKSVSYNTELYELSKEHATKKYAVELKNVKLKKNKFNPDEENVELNSYTKMAKYDDAEFACNPPAVDDFVQVKDVISMKDKTLVNITLYLDIEKHPISAISTTNRIVKKRDVSGNDSTGVIKCTIWETKLDELKADGVYDLVCAMVREFPRNVNNLNISTNTIISVSQEKISPAVAQIADLKVTEIEFPPEGVSITEYFVCQKCGLKIDNVPDDGDGIVMCGGSHCNFSKLKSKLQARFNATLFFDDKTISKVVLSDSAMQLYTKNLTNINVMNLTRRILTDSKSVALVNFKNICFGFKDDMKE